MSDAPRKPPKLASEPEAAGPAEPEAPRRDFHFKPTEFERANPPAGAKAGPGPIHVAQLYRAANSPAHPAPAAAPAPAENDVHAILRANHAANEAKGLNQVIPQEPPPSRRKRDYWLLLIAGNLLFGGFAVLTRGNPITLVFGFSGMIFFSVGLTWIMWGVMDKY